jgi:hypothetical protein
MPFPNMPAAQQNEGPKVTSRDVTWVLNIHEFLNLPVWKCCDANRIPGAAGCGASEDDMGWGLVRSMAGFTSCVSHNSFLLQVIFEEFLLQVYLHWMRRALERVAMPKTSPSVALCYPKQIWPMSPGWNMHFSGHHIWMYIIWLSCISLHPNLYNAINFYRVSLP